MSHAPMDAIEMCRYAHSLESKVDSALEDRRADIREMDDLIQDLKFAIVWRDLGDWYQDRLKENHPGAYSLLMCPRQEENVT